MTRASTILSHAAPLIVLYLLFLTNVISVPFLKPETSSQLLPVIPWTLLVSFGAYSLASLGWGLVTFRDCPDAYNELMQQITMAKDDLRSKGVSVDN